MSDSEITGVELMREHENACERETREAEPVLVAVLQDVVDCIITSAHAFEGLVNMDDAEQAILTQIILGARTARVFLALTLTGQYESALAVSRTLIEDGVACAYLVESPAHAARWRRGEIDPKYGEMAKTVIQAHARRSEDDGDLADAAAWRHAGNLLRVARKALDDVSHANPARISFVLKAHGYELYPFFDSAAMRTTSWFGLVGLAQMLSFPRKRLVHLGKTVPTCNTEALHGRVASQMDEIEKSGDPLGLHREA